MTIKNLLAELQRDYVATIPNKIKTIEALWEERKFTELETEYHKLKGTGRTYGVPELSQIGLALEQICETRKDFLPRAVPLSLKILHRIHQFRTEGQSIKLDDDPDYKAVIALLNEP